MYLIGVLLMALGIAASIALHEIGHLVPAKRFGVKVTQYMIGFGPTLFSRRRGETEYGVKAIPLGGYIRMVGMLPPRSGDPEGALRASSTGRFSQMVERAREDSFEEVEPGQEHRSFYRLPVWQKVAVMMGGPLMNLVLASGLIVLIACGVGLPTQTSAGVAGVSECLAQVVPQGQAAPTSCGPQDRSPAWRAGLRPQDRLLAVDGVPVATSADIVGRIRERGQQPVRLTIERQGARREVTLTPVLRQMPKEDDLGQDVLDSRGRPVLEPTPLIGINIGGTFETRRRPVGEAVGIVGDGLTRTAAVFVRIPQKMVGVWHAAFGEGRRDVNGPISVVGVGRIAGEAAEVKDVSLSAKLVMLLQLLASLNLALFVFNLVPLLPLDGGHVAGALWEGTKRGWARLRGIPGPVYADVSKALPLAYAVAVVMICMSVLLIYADLVNPVRLN